MVSFFFFFFFEYFNSFLLELNDEVYVDYIVAIVQEDNTKVEEKVGGIIDYLSAATSENLEPLKKELLEWITSFDETKKKQKEEQKLQKQKEEQMKLAKMKQEIQVKVDEYPFSILFFIYLLVIFFHSKVF